MGQSPCNGIRYSTWVAALFLGLSFFCGLCLCYHLLVIRSYFLPHPLPNSLVYVLCIYGYCHIPIAYNHGLHSPVAKLPICQESWGLLQDREPRHSDLFLPDTFNPWAFLWYVCVFRDLHYPKEGAVFWVPDTYFLVPQTWPELGQRRTKLLRNQHSFIVSDIFVHFLHGLSLPFVCM